MADIAKMADSANRIKQRSDTVVGWPLAAIKGIEAHGVRHAPDVKRLVPLVLRNLEERKLKPRGKSHAH